MITRAEIPGIGGQEVADPLQQVEGDAVAHWGAGMPGEWIRSLPSGDQDWREEEELGRLIAEEAEQGGDDPAHRQAFLQLKEEEHSGEGKVEDLQAIHQDRAKEAAGHQDEEVGAILQGGIGLLIEVGGYPHAEVDPLDDAAEGNLLEEAVLLEEWLDRTPLEEVALLVEEGVSSLHEEVVEVGVGTPHIVVAHLIEERDDIPPDLVGEAYPAEVGATITVIIVNLHNF